MDNPKLRITSSAEQPVNKAQVRCFVRQLCTDLHRKHPVIQWLQDGEHSKDWFYTHGLSEGSRIEIHPCDDSVIMRYTKNGELVYAAVETGGNQFDDTHLTSLYRLVSTTVRERDLVGKKLSAAQKAKMHYRVVSDIFRAVEAEQVADELLRKPSQLSLTISESSPEWNRRKDLIHAIVTFVQNVSRSENGLVLDGTWLKYSDGTLYPTPTPMVCLANAYTTIPNEEYSGLHPATKNVKLVAKIVASLILGL